MRGLSGFVALCFAFSFAANARADGNKLLQQCSSTLAMLDGTLDLSKLAGDEIGKVALDAGKCSGFVQGFTQTNLILQNITKAKVHLCFPLPTPERAGGIENDQAIRIFVKYLREHPEKLHQSEIGLAFAAFKNAFPCRE